MRRAAVSVENLSENPSTYFRRTKTLFMVVITGGLSYYTWALFFPSTIPYNLLGPLGTLTKYLVENHKTTLQIGYVVTWLIHLADAFYALRLCKIKGITDGSTQLQWFVQTFLFGLSSLIYLLVYSPKKKSQ
ncbi:transmembrane protein 254 isoform X2 [Rhineura floridana]|uniref:transmembrane protein 254 isoform X2 n=1 Tax=Rhineura floridana TaxID=261503 RepID=UPI002AC85DCB|nr:transmembrane protein 254 isoform X2 [Rhineura floridana]